MGVISTLSKDIANGDVKSLLLVSAVISLLAPFIYYLLFIKSSKQKPLPAKLANNKERKLGTWTPEDFKFPIPKPFEDWDIQTTKPIPYRAFKHKYNVTMGIRNMPYEDWIQLDNEWMKFHLLKTQRIKEKGTEIYGTLPEAYNAALELLAELREYLPNRYPSLFEQIPNGIKIIPTCETFNTVTPEIDPMRIVALLLQDDCALMIETDDGSYFLKAGCIMLAGFWRFKDKVNTSLASIHLSGDVPKYTTHLKKGMDKFFLRLTPEAPVVRNNYFLQTDDNLDWSSSIGPEDNKVVGWYTAPGATSVDQLWYRSERQSLRRLPLTGAVVFTIRTYFLPLTEMCKEPYVPQRLLDGIESWTDDVREYRGYSKFADVALPYLREKAEEQQKQGYVLEKEVSNFPF